MITIEVNFIFRRVSLPRHQKQRTYETSEKRIQDGKTRYMLRGVVSHIFMVMNVEGEGGREYIVQLEFFCPIKNRLE